MIDDLVDALLNICGGDIEVGPPVEFNNHIGVTFPRTGRDVSNILNPADPLLNEPRDRDLDIFRACPRILCADGDDRVGDIRKKIDGKIGKSNHTKKNDPDGYHKPRHRVL